MDIITDTEPTGDELSADQSELLPLAVVWAEAQSQNILAHGRPLAFWQVAEARQAGVRSPGKVRILGVDTLPVPADARLRAVLAAGLLNHEASALTFGHDIMILRSRIGERRILRRELRQVAQYEAAGSIGAFWAEYLVQIARLGYWEAPPESDTQNRRPGPPRKVPQAQLNRRPAVAKSLSWWGQWQCHDEASAESLSMSASSSATNSA